MAQEASQSNVELLIAYVIPGFTALRGLPFVPVGASGLVDNGSDVSLAGFLYGTVEAITAGLTVSAVRWLVVDTIHHRTGLRPPQWTFAELGKNVAAFKFLGQIHYRYYKYYANMVVALSWAYCSRDFGLGSRGLIDLLLVCLFFLGSRDSLGKYYARGGQLLSDRGDMVETTSART